MNFFPEYELMINAACEAGRAILKEYNNQSTEVRLKKDDSPVTQADLASNDIICRKLNETGIPVVSEEAVNKLHPGIDSDYWLVDPLDGTKEYIHRTGEFTVNIALLKNNRPYAGVIMLPVKDVVYFGGTASGSYKLHGASEKTYWTKDDITAVSEKLPLTSLPESFTILCSLSHLDNTTKKYIDEYKKKFPDLQTTGAGSSLKFCHIAEGKAHLYPRLGRTMEWDIAAGHAILQGAGCEIMDYSTGEVMKYGKPGLANGHFIAYRREEDLIL